MWVVNAFSANMLPPVGACEVRFEPVEDPALLVGLVAGDEPIQSAVGHADTAKLIGKAIQFKLVPNRTNVTLKMYERALLAQYTGPRLPEGATVLPEGATLSFLKVTVLPIREEVAVREATAPLNREIHRLNRLSPEELRAWADRKEAEAKAQTDASAPSRESWWGEGWHSE